MTSKSIFGNGELHYKMSKKIAQLTKVIFQLNTRNEDFRFEVSALKGKNQEYLKAYEEDAGNKIRKGNLKMIELQQKVKEYEQVMRVEEEAKGKAMASFETYKGHTKEQLVKLRLEFEQKIENANSQLQKAYQEFKVNLAKAKSATLDSNKQQQVIVRLAC